MVPVVGHPIEPTGNAYFKLAEAVLFRIQGIDDRRGIDQYLAYRSGHAANDHSLTKTVYQHGADTSKVFITRAQNKRFNVVIKKHSLEDIHHHVKVGRALQATIVT